MNKSKPVEIFTPPNMLKAKAGGTGIGLDAAALKRAEAAMEELKAEFADWMDADSLPRQRGAERDEYIADGLLVLPPNHPVREVDELRDVRGMTPELFAKVRPYLTTFGSGRIDVNSAPVPVLRALTGMTDDVVARILSARSAQRRIRSIAEIAPASGPGRPGTPGSVANRLSARLGFDASELLVTVRVARPVGPHAETLRAVVARNGVQTFVSRETW